MKLIGKRENDRSVIVCPQFQASLINEPKPANDADQIRFSVNRVGRFDAAEV
jgi:hypothetical protein